jgi:outer membrane protein
MAALAVTSLVAQEAPAELTLDEAVRLARDNNPLYLSTRNDQGAADWGVREAYGQFLPSANARGSMNYTEAGVQRIGTLDFGAQSTDWYSSNYSLSLTWNLDGNTLFGVSNARASQRATSARIDAARFTLESAVTLQYMAALRARDALRVAERQLARAEQNYEIVQERVAVGASAGTEGKQAAVDMGRAEVALIQAEQALRGQKLLLMERIGVTMDEEIRLASTFEIFEPTWSRGDLMLYALEQHPSLRAFVAQEGASRATVRQARSAYFPRFTLSTAFSGNTLQALNDDFLVSQAAGSISAQYYSCRRWKVIQQTVGELPGLSLPADCGSPELAPEQRDQLLAGNDVFPFDFTKNPLTLSLSVSVPVFNGFSRQRQVEQAEAAADDAHHSRRAEELRLRTAVTQAYNDLVAAYRVVQIEERNRELAEERLEMAQQRYAMGAGPSRTSGVVGSTFLELLDALASMSTAESDYLNATYDFHLALAQLEAATGRSLRPAGTGGDGV